MFIGLALKGTAQFLFKFKPKKAFLGTCNVPRGKGQNYENHNVENQKELRKLCRRSEHRKD